MSIFSKIGSSIDDFLQSKGLTTALKIAELIPISAAPAFALETIKNAVLGTIENPNPEFHNLPAEDQAKFLELYREESARIKAADEAELGRQKAEIEDRINARSREVAIAQTPKRDTMMFVSGLVGLLAFVFTVLATTFITIPVANEKLFDIMLGYVMGVATSIFQYYYGSSKGSADKTKLLEIK